MLNLHESERWNIFKHHEPEIKHFIVKHLWVKPLAIFNLNLWWRYPHLHTNYRGCSGTFDDGEWRVLRQNDWLNDCFTAHQYVAIYRHKRLIKRVVFWKYFIEYGWGWWWWWWWSLWVPAGPGHLACRPRWFLGLRLSPLLILPRQAIPASISRLLRHAGEDIVSILLTPKPQGAYYVRNNLVV